MPKTTKKLKNQLTEEEKKNLEKIKPEQEQEEWYIRRREQELRFKWNFYGHHRTLTNILDAEIKQKHELEKWSKRIREYEQEKKIILTGARKKILDLYSTSLSNIMLSEARVQATNEKLNNQQKDKFRQMYRWRELNKPTVRSVRAYQERMRQAEIEKQRQERQTEQERQEELERMRQALERETPEEKRERLEKAAEEEFSNKVLGYYVRTHEEEMEAIELE